MQHYASKILATVLALFVTAAVAAQATSRADFRDGVTQAVRLDDEKLMDQWMKKADCASHAALYYEELYIEGLNANIDNSKKTDAMMASWERCFEGGATLQKVRRWCDSMDRSMYDALQRGRNTSAKVWNNHIEMENPSREELLQTMQNFIQLADQARNIGHMIEVAELWSLAAASGNKIKKAEKTLGDRREVVRAREEFMRARDIWDFNFDGYYNGSKAFVKDELIRIAEEEKDAGKRRDEGYDDSAKGVDSLVLPDAKEEKSKLVYKALTKFEAELDYGPKNGAVPFLWWNTTTNEPGSMSKMAWFQLRDIYFGRTGGNKFAISLDPSDLDKAFEVKPSNKPKASTFWLDADKNLPYTMWFWMGSDMQKVGMADVNMASTKDYALVYYRSAASWSAKIGQDSLTFYDDSANGRPCDEDPWEKSFKVHTVGDYDGDGTPVPLLDSMRLGKSRVPYSEFIKLSTGWHHLRRHGSEEVGVRPLNPEYFKTGSAKLVWSGPKKSAPAQLVVQGRGDYKTAFFDLADGKEVELPVGEYRIVFGRIIVGKGTRVQNATIYEGESKPFTVEAGKTTELAMGAPFQIQWTRKGDQNLSIDALKVFVRESSGCYLTELQGMPLAPDVMASKSEDGKGARPVGKFVPFTDGELVRVAGNKFQNLSSLCALFPMPHGYREGALLLSIKLQADGMKVGLVQKKHAVFGSLEPLWQ